MHSRWGRRLWRGDPAGTGPRQPGVAFRHGRRVSGPAVAASVAVAALAGLVPGVPLPSAAAAGRGAPAGATTTASTAPSVTAPSVTAPSIPASAVGQQLSWLLSISTLPLSTATVSAHFDATFLAQVTPSQLNAVLATLSGPGPVTLVKLTSVEATSLVGLVAFGMVRYTFHLSVDPTGRIDGLLFTPANLIPHSWAAIDDDLRSVAPQVSLLAARVGTDGTCTPVHAMAAGTPRPLGSMFKLFVLGALATAIQQHKVRWDQEVTVTAGSKVGGSGTLDTAPAGTALSVQQAAVKMISVSDNTAADLLLRLVGRPAVEAQVRRWSSHASLDDPFLTVSELFALKYDDYPSLATHYLSLGPAARARYLASTVDHVPTGAERQSTSPRPSPPSSGSPPPTTCAAPWPGCSGSSADLGSGPSPQCCR